MTAHSYDELIKSKHRLSLLLFLFLNSASSIFSMLAPIDGNSLFSVPLVCIAIVSISGLIMTFFNTQEFKKTLNIYSIIIGLLWAWHIVLKYHQVALQDKNFLLLSLFSIFFISAIALSDNFLAFCLHAVPAAITVIFLDDFQNIVRILFTIALPMVGFSLHHLMLKRSDAFTRTMVKNLYDEREKFSDLSMIDPLTGLYNRRGLQNKLETLLSNNQSNHYLMLLDIDHFKAYNDNYGHTMGDQALVRVAAAIRDAVRSRDIVVRYGGEEFLVLLTNVECSYALQLAKRIQKQVLALEIPHMFNDKVSTNVTISAGLAMLSADDWDTALSAADIALYQAKHSGRNKIELAQGEDLKSIKQTETA